MKSSACSTTTSKRLLRASTIALLLIAPAGQLPLLSQAVPASQSAIATDALQSYETLAAATQLNREGQPPFHLRIEAQLFDLDGKPSEKATVEEWWASPKQYRIEMKSPSLNRVDSTLDKTDSTAINRASFLLQQLLDQTIHPLPALGTAEGLTVQELDRHLGGQEMKCLVLQNAQGAANGYIPETYCLDATQVLRVSANGASVLTRNRTGRFQDTSVALKVSIVYDGREATSGEVSVLQSLNPAQSSLAEFTSKPATVADAPANPPFQSPVVAAGRKIGGSNLQYPYAARQQHRTGTIVLCGVITSTGKVAGLDVIAGTDRLLVDAALAAARTWTFNPYLLNGTPTAVSTVFTINFRMGG